ncbi:MAG: site-specific DNA-methyltransferase, partial [Candidatus Paceibacterota bacterium]
MSKVNFRSIILSVLEADERIWFQNEEGEKELNQTLLLDLIEKIDDKIINLLLQEESLREKFFAKISPDNTEKQSTYIFKMNDFRFFMEENKIDNSYTAYKNRIGLTDGNKFLKDSNDIVLNWPYKDCILEGGQSNEDGTDTYFEYSEKTEQYEQKQGKRKEIFFNSVLAPDEIDRLIDKKALVNWKRFTKDGEIPLLRGGDKVDGVDAIKRDKNGTIAENMIIKGNNLLAMHSLKKQFAGKVKLIYIDPPYNTGNDGFKYNDSFNHSTWLTFMKNRLEAAKKILSNDGSIFLQIDDFECAYLKVLLDEVFGRENFRNQITWKRRGGSANPTNRLNNVTDYILWYTKTDKFQYEPIFSMDDENTQKYIKERFNNVDENGRKFMKSPLQSPNPRPNLIYDYKGYKTPQNGYSISKKMMEEWDQQGKLWFPENKNQNINRKIYLDEYKGQPVSSLWNDISVINPMSKERTEFETGQKPESLLSRIIQMVTKENDIVLDYHLGSGSTASTAHKMNRQYIGIEQMDYIETIAVERLKKVIGKNVP